MEDSTTLNIVETLVRVIDKQFKELEDLASSGLQYIYKSRDLEAELQKKNESVSDLEDQLAEALERIEELEAGITETDCRACGQDTYEQQQNYERIKEQLYSENEELKRALEGEGKELDKAIKLLRKFVTGFDEEQERLAESKIEPDTPIEAYKFNSIKKELYIGYLRKGYARGYAATLVGVHRATVSAHMKADKEFADAVSHAETDAVENYPNSTPKQSNDKIKELQRQLKASETTQQKMAAELIAWAERYEGSLQRIARLKRELDDAHASISREKKRNEQLKLERDERLPVETTEQIGSLMRKPLLR